MKNLFTVKSSYIVVHRGGVALGQRRFGKARATAEEEAAAAIGALVMAQARSVRDDIRPGRRTDRRTDGRRLSPGRVLVTGWPTQSIGRRRRRCDVRSAIIMVVVGRRGRRTGCRQARSVV